MLLLERGYWVGWIHHWSDQVGHFLAAYSSNVQNRASLYKDLYKHAARNKSASIRLLFQYTRQVKGQGKYMLLLSFIREEALCVMI